MIPTTEAVTSLSFFCCRIPMAVCERERAHGYCYQRLNFVNNTAKSKRQIFTLLQRELHLLSESRNISLGFAETRYQRFFARLVKLT